jgi:hypothetical protein
MPRELTEAEIQEILREEGLVVSKKKTGPKTREDSFADESEKQLQDILDGKDPNAPKSRRSTISYRASPKSPNPFSPVRSLMRSFTDPRSTRRKYQLPPRTKSPKKPVVWTQEKLEKLNPQEAIDLLEEVSAQDPQLAEALVKFLKGKPAPSMPLTEITFSLSS